MRTRCGIDILTCLSAWAVTACTVMVLCVPGCAARQAPGLPSAMAPQPASASPVSATPGAPTAGAAPAGVDAKLWRQLSAELARVIAQAGTARRTSAVPTGKASAVPDFAVRYDNTQYIYTWSYRQQGDYDLNGIVNAADLVQVAIHFGQTSLAPDWIKSQLADGNGDGAIGIGDVAAIGMNFGGRIDGYELQRRPNTSSDPWTMLSDPGFIHVAPQNGQYPQYSVTGPDEAVGPLYRAVPYVLNGANRIYGVSSNIYDSMMIWPSNCWTTARGNSNRDGMLLADGPASAAHVTAVPLGAASYYTMFNEPVSDFTGTVYLGTTPNVGLGAAGPGWFYGITPEGKVRWHFQTSAGICGTASISRQLHIVVGDLNGMLYSFAPDGKLYWQRMLTATAAVCAPLLAEDGTIYIVAHQVVGSGILSSALYSLSADGALNWSREYNAICVASPVFDPEGEIGVITDDGHVVAYTPAGALWFKFALANPPHGLGILCGSAMHDGRYIYSSDNNLVAAVAYDNASTDTLDLGGQDALTMPAFNILGDGMVGVDNAGIPELRYYSGGALIWHASLYGNYLSNIAVDVAGQSYLTSCIVGDTGPNADYGVYSFRQDQTKQWYYDTGDSLPLQVSLVAGHRLACGVLTLPDSFSLLLISDN
jgi:hypothetical protein